MDPKLKYHHSEIKYQNPIATLKDEHLETVQRLEMIERTLQYLESLPSRTALQRCKIEQFRLRDWVNELDADMARHFLIEEEALFPTLSEHIGKEHGLIEVMLEEHRDIREALSGWKREVDVLSKSFPGAGRDENLKQVGRLGGKAMSLLRLHIKKENQILFKISEISLSDQEKKFVAQKRREIETNYPVSRQAPKT